MYNQISIVHNIILIMIKNTILDMTIDNPIFIFAIIIVIWFIPGIMVRRFTEIRQQKKKQKIQADAIKKLYPNSKE